MEQEKMAFFQSTRIKGLYHDRSALFVAVN